jgi:hypothetical protein
MMLQQLQQPHKQFPSFSHLNKVSNLPIKQKNESHKEIGDLNHNIKFPSRDMSKMCDAALKSSAFVQWCWF